MSRSRLAAAVLALLTAVSIWLSAGVVVDGVSERNAALPSFQLLAVLAIAAVAVAWVAKLRLEHAWPLAISFILWLPFLGSTVIWEGPIEGIVWLLVVGGLIVARPPETPEALISPAVAPWIAALTLALASLLVFGQVRNVIPGGDEPHYLAATQSLLHDADLKVENNYARGEYLEYFPGRLEPHFLKRSTGGEIYSIHAPGVSVIVLPAFAAAGYTGAVWTMILVAAITAGLMWRLAFTLSGSPAAAWIGVAGVGFTAPYFFHTFTIYPEMIGALCVLLGVSLLIKLGRGADPGTRVLVATGAALAVLPWLHTRFAVLAGIVGVLVVARLGARPSSISKIAAFLAVPIVFGAAWFAFFYVIWGSVNPAVPYGADTSTAIAYMPRGVVGLLFDQQFGVLTTAPIYVIALAGGIALLRTQPRLGIELALIVIPYTMTVASYAMWWGGAAAPGRFLIAILPLAALPLAVICSQSNALRTVALVLTVASAALIVPRALEDNGRFIYNNRSGIDATLQWLSANYGLADVVPSVHRNGGAAALREGLIWLTGLAVAAIGAGLLARRRSAGARFAIAGALLACAVPVSARLISQADYQPRPNRGLVMLERLRPWHTTFIEVYTRKRATADYLLQRLPTSLFGPATVLDRVPAGEYEIVAAPGTAAGSMTISLGRNDAPIAQPSLDDLRNPHAPFKFRLPVMARTLNVRIETDAREHQHYALRPTGIAPSGLRQPATRAARFGHGRAFFFDDWAYPEKDGFWTRADGRAMVVIDTDEGTRRSGMPISITAGAVPTRVTLSVGNWQETFALAAGQQQDVALPAAPDGVWALSIQSGPGFRPSERDPASRDVRSLAAWIAIH